MIHEETSGFETRTKPEIHIPEIFELVGRLYGIRITRIQPLDGYDDSNHWIEADNIENPYESKVWPHGYVLKIMNNIDSLNESLVQAQNGIMLHLDSAGFKVPKPVANIHGKMYSFESIKKGGSSLLHVVRLLTFHPGAQLKNVTPSPTLYYNIGLYMGNVSEALTAFTHPALMKRISLWQLKRAPTVKALAHLVEDSFKRTLVVETLAAFEEQVLSQEEHLEKGTIHGDMNEQNIIVKGNDVVSLIDFGDCDYAPILFEIAICMSYMLLNAQNMELGKHTLAGFTKKRKLTTLEIKLLKVCICTRLCQSLVLGLHTYSLDPRNEYVLSSQDKGWKLLLSLSKIEEKELITMWDLKS